MVLCKAIIRSLNTNYKYNLISYDKITRHETQPYPDVAVREGIYNALMHNDWSSCQPITIKVFDLKMEIINRLFFLQAGRLRIMILCIHLSRMHSSTLVL